MAVVKRLFGVRHRFGGAEHSGWLPLGAAIPPPTPFHDVTIDLRIESEGPGFILYCEAREDARFCSDTWCDTLSGALAAAEERFNVAPGRWEDAEPGAAADPGHGLRFL
jgi:hypothetical protein